MKHGISIELDKRRTLRYGMNALIIIEEMTGKTLTQLDMEHMSMKDLRTMVYAGLFHEDPSLTPEQCGDFIDTYSNITLVAEKMGEAMTLAFGSKSGNKHAVEKANL